MNQGQFLTFFHHLNFALVSHHRIFLLILFPHTGRLAFYANMSLKRRIQINHDICIKFSCNFSLSGKKSQIDFNKQKIATCQLQQKKKKKKKQPKGNKNMVLWILWKKEYFICELSYNLFVGFKLSRQNRTWNLLWHKCHVTQRMVSSFRFKDHSIILLSVLQTITHTMLTLS